MTIYWKDEAGTAGVHLEFVPHEELILTDEELEKLKGRARHAVTMDGAARPMPREYQRFLDGGREPSSYDAFLRGEQ